MFGKEKPSWNLLWFKVKACNEQSVLLIKCTHVQAGLCQSGCGLSALLEVDLEPWKVSETCAEALHGSLLWAPWFPLLHSLLAKEIRKRASLHRELSFIFMHLLRALILQVRAVAKIHFPWNKLPLPTPTPQGPNNYIGHMFYKKHFSQKQYLMWNRIWQLSFNETLNMRF